jgi:hypothetical protein
MMNLHNPAGKRTGHGVFRPIDLPGGAAEVFAPENPHSQPRRSASGKKAAPGAGEESPAT